MKKEETSTSGALVLQTKGPYRTIAQVNWGLTNEEMKGMHVHHRIPRSMGGSNDPTNLYVCSPWFHYWVWHGRLYGCILSSGTAGKKFSDETKAKMSAWQKGISKSEETCKKMSEAAKKRKRQPWSKETKAKMSASHQGKKVTCPHCGTVGHPSPMSRWHFDRCRHA